MSKSAIREIAALVWHNLRMGVRAPQTKRKIPKLFIGEWIDALGYKDNEIAARVPMSASYISRLRHPRTSEDKNPTISLVYCVSEALGVPIDFLLHPPPAPDDIDAMRRLPRPIVNLLTRNERLS